MCSLHFIQPRHHRLVGYFILSHPVRLFFLTYCIIQIYSNTRVLDTVLDQVLDRVLDTVLDQVLDRVLDTVLDQVLDRVLE